MQQREQRDRKAIGKTTEAAREAYKDLPIQQSIISKPQQMTNSTSTNVTHRGA